jgi:hypothetical protein
MARFLERTEVKRWGRIVERTDLSQSACGAKKDVTKNNGEGGWRDINSSLSLFQKWIQARRVNIEQHLSGL